MVTQLFVRPRIADSVNRNRILSVEHVQLLKDFPEALRRKPRQYERMNDAVTLCVIVGIWWL